MNTSPLTQDIPRTIFAVLFIGGLIAGSLWILRPFLPAVIWATMIVVATWPVLLRVQGWLWGRRWLAVAVMTCLLLLVLVVPLSLAIGTIVANADVISGWSEVLSTLKLSQPPVWVEKLPLVGKRAAQTWSELAASGQEELAKKFAPYAAGVVRWFVDQLGSFGMMTIQFLLTVVVASVLFATGETVAEGVRRFGRRLAGVQGENAVILAGQAIRGVALGVVVTACVQAALGGIGLAIAGVPFATILTAIMFLLCVARVGPGLVMLAGVGWLYWDGSVGWAMALLAWSILVGPLVKNVLGPILMRRGAQLPLVLILPGVLGGLIAFGLVGIFIGPMVLAVSYRLLEAWVCEELAEQAPAREPS
ncbi:MAG TPA: AI-2E family transporter YdiK [Nitrospiraceae bacterium]|nr:AI-2E family transporter YdiK [Nitrospiraceae bacterium]